jgi:hypothetical protein
MTMMSGTAAAAQTSVILPGPSGAAVTIDGMTLGTPVFDMAARLS